MLKIVKDSILVNTWQLSQNGFSIGYISYNNRQFLFSPLKEKYSVTDLRNIKKVFTTLELSRLYGTLDSIGICLDEKFKVVL